MAFGRVRAWRVAIGAVWLSVAAACPGHRKPTADGGDAADAADATDTAEDRSVPTTEVADVPIPAGDGADALIDLSHPDGDTPDLQSDGPTPEAGPEVAEDAADAETTPDCHFGSIANFCPMSDYMLGCQNLCDCLGTWSGALAYCASAEGFPYAFENCAGFDILIVSGIEGSTVLYYNSSSRLLVGVAQGYPYQTGLKQDLRYFCLAGEIPSLSTDTCQSVPTRLGCAQ